SKHKIENLSDESAVWSVTNNFDEQPLKLRLEAMTSALPYDSGDGVTLLDFSSAIKFDEMSMAEGVRYSIKPSDEQTKDGLSCGKIEASNDGQNDPKAAWGQAKLEFSPPLDLSKNQALGMWIYGDGKGEVLNFQLKSPEHLISGLAERYVIVDFIGWKYFELLELESERYANYKWPYGSPYSIYRENVHFDSIDALSIWCNDIPKNESICCWISPVKALPHQSVRIKNPALSVNGKTITFPVELETGQYLEFYSESDCKQFSANGDLIGEVKPLGGTPSLVSGSNTVQFNCVKPVACNPRVKINVISQGK
ncbi:hypothetical protein K8I31_13895, partial [bacterium]|nr:hypothetical protein [bacterium]